jgi:hypothetical protein
MPFADRPLGRIRTVLNSLECDDEQNITSRLHACENDTKVCFAKEGAL